MSDRPAGPQMSGEERLVAPSSVWPNGQRDLSAQLRDSGYVHGTETDPHLIPPDVAAHVIATYTRPGELVLDPDCGAGTVLVEALRTGRHALGLTAHKRWWTLARANITATKRTGAWRDGSVLDASPRVLASVRAAGLVGRVGLVLTALRTLTNDLGASTTNPGPDRDSNTVVDGLAATLACCEPLLRCGSHLVVVARPCRRADGSLVDLTTPLIAAGTSAGLALVERCIALTAALQGSRLVTRATLADRRAAARARTAGVPVALTAHHEVLVFQRAHDAELAAMAADTPGPHEHKATQRAADVPGWRRAA